MSRRHPRQNRNSEAGRVIRRAALFIEEHGWIQGSAGSKQRGFCVLGAIDSCVPTSHGKLKSDAQVKFGSWLQETTGEPVSIPGWNDTKGRTQDEVLTHLYKFADEFDPQGPRID